MEAFELLLHGLSLAFTVPVLLAVFTGVLLGLAVGALPALGPSAGIAILLPSIVNLDPTLAIAGLCGIYYGSMYGASVTSILIGVPGDSSAMMTVLDGHPLAKRGEAGRALGMSIYASFIGGIVSLVLMTMLSLTVAQAALAFGPAEMTAMMVMALSLVTVLGGEERTKGFIALGLGIWIGMVGLDAMEGSPRFTFGSINLLSGFEFTIVVIGVYGLGQMFVALSMIEKQKQEERPAFRLGSLKPNLADILYCKWSIMWSAFIGFFIGLLPGAGSTAATIFSYGVAKKTAKDATSFGKGDIRGIAAPETANGSSSYANMIPLFSLGIPGSGATAVLMGGLLMLGLQPGPMLFQEQPDFVWTLIATFFIGNTVLVILTLALIPLLALFVFIRMSILFPIVLCVIIFGSFSVNYSFFDVGAVIMFALAGYLLKKLDYPLLPLLLGVILGPILEQSFRRSLTISQGDYMIFLDRPISLFLLMFTAAFLFLPFLWRIVKRNYIKQSAVLGGGDNDQR